jgi:hypothetical protein
MGKRGIKVTTEDFIARANKIHNHKYDYSETKYVNTNTKMVFICPIHGKCSHLAKTHLMGRGCNRCGNNMISQKEFIKQAEQIHGERYSYEKTKYHKKMDKIIITCQKHGDFQQVALKHLSGQGCPKCNRSEICGTQRTTPEQFLFLCHKVHGDRYDYSNTKFVNWKTKIEITCKKHGVFQLDPSGHTHGKSGCPSCGFNTSIDGDRWIASFNNSSIAKEKVMNIGGRRFKVDGYDPNTKTIYEYFGSYWHGHPDRFNSDDIHPIRKITYGELYQETLNRIKHFEDNNYSVIFKWGR